MVHFEDDGNDDESEDRDLPQASDVDASDTDPVDTSACPGCGRHVYEDADLCPYCGQFLLREATGRKPPWVIAVIVACLILIVLISMR